MPIRLFSEEGLPETAVKARERDYFMSMQQYIEHVQINNPVFSVDSIYR